MSNIYDEAINETKELKEKYSTTIHSDTDFNNIIHTLERAKKVEELLGLYQKQNENITSFDYWKVSPIDVIQCKRWIEEIDKTEQQIKQLEEELKWHLKKR